VSSLRTDTPQLDPTTTPNRRRRHLTRAIGAVTAGAALALAVANWAPVASAAPAAPLSAARLAHIRVTALHWAEDQTGKWYCWAGAGPTCYDCSGLVMAAYQEAGISLPHSTYAMLDSGLLEQVSAADRRPGDLAFYGTGHVELVTRYGTFGALETGTQIGYHDTNEWWHPTMYFEVK
jgi:cell wall-associated NlpC family hydrolase